MKKNDITTIGMDLEKCSVSGERDAVLFGFVTTHYE